MGTVDQGAPNLGSNRGRLRGIERAGEGPTLPRVERNGLRAMDTSERGLRTPTGHLGPSPWIVPGHGRAFRGPEPRPPLDPAGVGIERGRGEPVMRGPSILALARESLRR